jgi:uncharacterized membrane protein
MKTIYRRRNAIPDVKRGNLEIAAAGLCAALYAVSNVAFAAVPTPWGIGQFRPGVIIPALFAVLFGPWVGAIGASLGTQLSSMYLPTGLGPIGSLVSGVPGNFFGFYLLGWLVRRKKNWTGFLQGSLVGLIVGNLAAASGVMFWLTLIVPRWATWALVTKIGVILGLTLFWFATMLPFVLILVPILIRGVKPVNRLMSLGAIRISPDLMKFSSYSAVPIFAIFVLLSIDNGLSSTVFYAVPVIYREAVILLLGLSAVFVLAYGIIVRRIFNGTFERQEFKA